LAAVVLAAIPVWAAETDAELLDRVRKAIKDAELERAAANFSVFSQQGGGLVSLSGRCPTQDVKQKILAVVEQVPNVKQIDHLRLTWPSFFMVTTSNLQTNDEHQQKYLDLLRKGYLLTPRDPGMEYTAKDGPVVDGIVPFRVLIEHTSSAISYGPIQAQRITGVVVKQGTDLAFDPTGNLGAGYQFHYRLDVKEKGSIKYTFQKWDGTQYKNLGSASLPVNTSSNVEVAQGDIALGKPPAKAPPCPLDISQCRAKAVNALEPPKPDPKTMTGVKITAKFADSSDALAKRVAAAPPKQRVSVDILLQNNSPWPIGSVSCYLVDARKPGFDGYQCGLNQLSPRLLPGEQRKVTLEMLPPESRAPNAIGYFLSKSLTITKLEPRFELYGILE
jgi:hypothetical protein